MAELLDLAARVAGWAHDHEQVEVYAVHDRETEVRAYEGEIESFSSAESRIRDADSAEETANMTRGTILQQAGVSILAQANQQPQLALQLLR